MLDIIPAAPEGTKYLIMNRGMKIAAVELANGNRAVVLDGDVFEREDAFQFVLRATKIGKEEVRGIRRMLETGRNL